MDNLIFSLNATLPIFLLMILGLLFRKLNWIDEILAAKMNQFVFRVPLPIMLFCDLATVDIKSAWNGRFVLFCFLVTLSSILLSALISMLWKEKQIQGEFIQASYRSSAALLGIAFIQNIYGNTGMAPLMILGSVPLYNMMAVIILSFFQPERKALDKHLLKKTLRGIVTNPIIIAIALGFLWSGLRLPMPFVLHKVTSNIGATATPLGLMAMGASFDINKALGKIRPALTATFIKLIGFCALFLPIAIFFGFRNEELIAILVMLGSATTVSCYVMSKNMGHDGVLTSSVIMLTTLLSAFSITGWLYVLKSFGFI